MWKGQLLAAMIQAVKPRKISQLTIAYSDMVRNLDALIRSLDSIVNILPGGNADHEDNQSHLRQLK
jgi:hypothetical protein